MKLLLNIMIIASVLTARTAKAADEVAKRGTAQPAMKDRLSVTVKLSKAVFAADEGPKFTVQFKNVSDKPFVLYDVEWFWNWNIRFEDMTRQGTWQLKSAALTWNPNVALDRAAAPVTTRTCKPGEMVEVVVDLSKRNGEVVVDPSKGTGEVVVGPSKRNGEVVADPSKSGIPFLFIWQGAVGKPVVPGVPVVPLPPGKYGLKGPQKRLSPGKYRLTVETDLKEGPNLQEGPLHPAVAFWTGQLKTESVEFEITEDSAVTQPTKRQRVDK